MKKYGPDFEEAAEVWGTGFWKVKLVRGLERKERHTLNPKPGQGTVHQAACSCRLPKGLSEGLRPQPNFTDAPPLSIKPIVSTSPREQGSHCPRLPPCSLHSPRKASVTAAQDCQNLAGSILPAMPGVPLVTLNSQYSNYHLNVSFTERQTGTLRNESSCLKVVSFS